MTINMHPAINVLFSAATMLPEDAKDDVIDAVEARLHTKLQEPGFRGKLRVRLFLGVLGTARAFLNVPDDDVDQLNPV